MPQINIDIFCQVIDNFGDAGVCIRMARQLYSRGHKVKIYTDQADLLHKIYTQDKIAIYNWDTAKTAVKNGLVIETFGCELPTQYKDTIKTQNCVWINLEYLSAENWVNGFHTMPSPQSNGVNKYFFMPGFTEQTGGLLRDDNELSAYSQLKSQRIDKIEQICQTKLPIKNQQNDAWFIFLFCYPNAPLAGLLQALESIEQDVYILLAGKPHNIQPQNQLKIIDVPFIQQTEFDSLLWLSDMNFVRGEDSLAQASWCPSPMVWQAYVQDDSTHIDKLMAWLAIQNLPTIIADFILAWNQSNNNTVAQLLPQILQTDLWSKWVQASVERAKYLRAQNDLLSNLEQFFYKNSALI